jgi:hypothetical protein
LSEILIASVLRLDDRNSQAEQRMLFQTHGVMHGGILALNLAN